MRTFWVVFKLDPFQHVTTGWYGGVVSISNLA